MMNHTRTVLVVEDNHLVGRAIERSLKGFGISVEVAANRHAAIVRMKAQDYAAVAVDYALDNDNGLALIEVLRDIQPQASYLLLSGHFDFDLLVCAVNQYRVSFVVPKPWNNAQFAQLIERSIVEYRARVRQQLRSEVAAKAPAVSAALIRARQFNGPFGTQHGRRIGSFARQLGQVLGLPETELQSLCEAALFHDIFFLSLPESVLLKPGPLSPTEWPIIHQHPLLCSNLLAEAGGHTSTCRILEQHHERWDGRGYPEGIVGTAISPAARVFAVADTLDAILWDRPYRPARPFQRACDEVQRCAGTQFDPEVAAAFLSIEPATWNRF